MYSLVVIAVLSIVEANQEFTCKPQPGCHFARCSHLWPITEPALRERNEFPINCVKNGTDPKDEDQDLVLKSHKQMISELTDKLTEANETIKELEKNSDETSKVMASQTKNISKLTDDLVKANGKIEELEKNSDGTLKEMAAQTQKMSELMADLTDASQRIKKLEENSALQSLEQKFSVMTNDLTAANGRIRELEKKPDFCAFTYRGKCFWFEMDDRISCERASEICAARGGKPANIYSQLHYYMLLGYLRMFGKTYGYAWLGLKYNPNTNVVSLSDGSTATFVKWYPGFPYPQYGSCVYLLAKLDRSSATQNLANGHRNRDLAQGVVCEI